MSRCNCLVVALSLWRRRGGYIAIRRSRHFLGLHFLWVSPDRRRVVHYEPVAPMRHWWSAVVHQVWYAGKVCRRD